MKKKYGVFFGFAVLWITVIFTLVGCGDKDSGDPTSPPGTPIAIGTLAELMGINANFVNLSKNYILTADITGPVTTPIGSTEWGMVPFTGNFDGNGHAITLNITSGSVAAGGDQAGTYGGLFACIGGSVYDLTVEGTVAIPSGVNVYSGGVAGVTLQGASISNVASSVNVSSSGSGYVHVGGVVGASLGTVSSVYATGSVSATISGAMDAYAGGIAGVARGAVSYAYATGSISATGTGAGIAAAGENQTTVGAGGIAGDATSAVVKYTVAMNSSISASDSESTSSYNKCSYRIASTAIGYVTTIGATNYGKSDLIPTGGLHGEDEGADQQDGVDVTVTGGPLPTAYTAPGQDWWRNTGFNGADWTTVWQWDTTTGLPKLR
jgi:hypothetical protein